MSTLLSCALFSYKNYDKSNHQTCRYNHPNGNRHRMFTAPQIIGRFLRVLHAILRAERIEIVVHGHGNLIVFRNGHIIQLQNEHRVVIFFPAKSFYSS